MATSKSIGCTLPIGKAYENRPARQFDARLSGLASGPALAVRPAGLAEVSRVNGAPQARPAQRDAKHR